MLEELKVSYKEESGNLKDKVSVVKNEKNKLAEKLTDTSVHVETLCNQVNGYKTSLRLVSISFIRSLSKIL